MINNYQREGHSNKDITTAVVTAVTATARLRGGWREAGRMGGKKGVPPCNNTQQSNNIVQHPSPEKKCTTMQGLKKNSIGIA